MAGGNLTQALAADVAASRETHVEAQPSESTLRLRRQRDQLVDTINDDTLPIHDKVKRLASGYPHAREALIKEIASDSEFNDDRKRYLTLLLRYAEQLNKLAPNHQTALLDLYEKYEKKGQDFLKYAIDHNLSSAVKIASKLGIKATTETLNYAIDRPLTKLSVYKALISTMDEASLNATDHNSYTPLMRAAIAPNNNAVSALASCPKTNIHVKTSKSHPYASHTAAIFAKGNGRPALAHLMPIAHVRAKLKAYKTQRLNSFFTDTFTSNGKNRDKHVGNLIKHLDTLVKQLSVSRALTKEQTQKTVELIDLVKSTGKSSGKRMRRVSNRSHFDDIVKDLEGMKEIKKERARTMNDQKFISALESDPSVRRATGNEDKYDGDTGQPIFYDAQSGSRLRFNLDDKRKYDTRSGDLLVYRGDTDRVIRYDRETGQRKTAVDPTTVSTVALSRSLAG